MTGTDILLLVVAVLLVPFGGALAAVDSALTRVSAARVQEMVLAGGRGAAALAAVIGDRVRHTNLLLLLRVVAETTATVLVTIVAREEIGSGWQVVALTVVVMVVVSYVLVGVGPRTLGRQHPYGVALVSASPVLLLGRVFGPLASLLIVLGNAVTPGRGFREGPFATEVELRELVDLAEARGVVEHGERDMIHSVFELGDTIAREVMVPRTDMVWVEQTKNVGQALALALRSGFSRIPVVGENVDDVVGVVYLKDVTRRVFRDRAAEQSVLVRDAMRPAQFVPESKPVDDLLREMQRDQTHVAVVVDEYGGTAGLVTIEDVLEEIVGEIADEHDREEAPVEPLGDPAEQVYRVRSNLHVDDLGELFGKELDDEDVDTVGGLLAKALGRVPIPGARAVVAGIALEAEQFTGRRHRLSTVLVRPAPREGGPDGERSGAGSRPDGGVAAGRVAGSGHG